MGSPGVAPWAMRPPPPGHGLPPPPAGAAGGDYTQTAAFRVGGAGQGHGRFQAGGLAPGQAAPNHWEQKGLANDSAGRMMGHYFDFDQWQVRSS